MNKKLTYTIALSITLSFFINACSVKNLEGEHKTIENTSNIHKHNKELTKIVVVPATYKMVKETILIKKEETKIITIPKKHKQIKGKKVIIPSQKKEVKVPAIYRKNYKKIIDTPSYTKKIIINNQ